MPWTEITHEHSKRSNDNRQSNLMDGTLNRLSWSSCYPSRGRWAARARPDCGLCVMPSNRSLPRAVSGVRLPMNIHHFQRFSTTSTLGSAAVFWKRCCISCGLWPGAMRGGLRRRASRRLTDSRGRLRRVATSEAMTRPRRPRAASVKAVDADGTPIAMVIHPANTKDRDGAPAPTRKFTESKPCQLEIV